MQQIRQNIKTKRALLLLLKNSGAPIVLYLDNPDEEYTFFKQVIQNASVASPKLIEKFANGPIKKFSVLDTQILSVVIQEEPSIG